MSVNGVSSDPDRISKKHSHKRIDSDELGVFEAARYFSTYNLEPSKTVQTHYKLSKIRERWGLGGGRISLDLPIPSSSDSTFIQQRCYHNHSALDRNSLAYKEKITTKHKQPTSPGGRIASFLNSLFHQGRSKKKSKSTTQSVKDQEEESPGWRRRRRSSISNFILSSSKNKSTNTNRTDSSSKSLYSSSSSGFRTPPPYTNTPTKSFKELLNYSSQKQVVSLDEHRRSRDLSWLDEKLNLIESLSEKQRVWADYDHHRRDPGETKLKGKEKSTRKFSDSYGQDVGRDDDDDDDEDADDEEYNAGSDSSSDLFELQNYDLANGGLPVYETTDMESIKRVAPTSNGLS